MALHGTYDPANIFARILEGAAPCVAVLDTPDVLALMDVFPQSRGHVLVIPRVPARTLLDASPDCLAPLILATQAIAKAVDKAFKPDGIKVVQYNGAPAGQSVFHLHFHVIPRYEGVALGAHGGGMADRATLEANAALIRAAL